MSSSQIFIQFLGGDQVTGTFTDAFGQSQTLQSNTAYSLDQLTAPGSQYASLSVTDFSGRVYVSYGAYGLQNMGLPGGSYTPAAAVSTDPNYLTRYQYFEPTITTSAGSGTQIFADLSYIDFTSISLSMYARTAAGQNNPTVTNGNQPTSPTQILVNSTAASATSPALAILPSGASGSLPASTFTRVISPQFSATGTYHDFANYLTYLTDNATNVRLAGTFVGTGSQPTGDAATQAQTYDFTGEFKADGILLTAQSDSGNGNVSWIGNNQGTGVGNSASIFISYASLNSQNGIYGNNTPYSVTLGTAAAVPYPSITNDVWGRVVGDLLAGLSFGYVGSETDVTGTSQKIGELASSQWWAAGEASDVTYLPDGTPVHWRDTPAAKGQYFGNVQTQSDFYNGYAASLAPDTKAYGFPLQDRLGNNLLTFNTNAPLTSDTHLFLTINADAADNSPIATGIWNGSASDGKWSTAANWNNSVVPSGTATVQFAGSFADTINVDTITDRSAAGIYFNYTAGNFTLANNTITLTGDVVNSSSKAQTIGSGLILGSNSIVTAARGDLTFDGPVALSNSATANTLKFAGTENSTVNGDISDGSAAGGKVVKIGTGTLALNGTNTFTGGLFHEGGTLILGSDAAAGTGTLTLRTSTVQAGEGNRTLANALVLDGNITIAGSNGLTFNGSTTLSTDSTITNAAPVTFAGSIGESSSGTSLTKAGNGTMTFSGSSPNTFTGLLSVKGGVLQLDKASGPAYGGSLSIGDVSGASNSSVVRLLASNQTASTAVTIAADGQLDLQAFGTTVGNITLNGGNIAGTGTLSIANGSTVQFTGTKNTSSTISTGIALGAGSVNFDIAKNSSPTELSITGAVSGNGTFTKSGSGVLSTLGSNTFNGAVTVAGGILAASSLDDATVSVSNGALSPGGTGMISTISLGRLNATSGSSAQGAFAMDLGASNTSDLITVATPSGINLEDNIAFLFSSAGFSSGLGEFTLISGLWQALPDPSTFTFTSIDIAGLTGTFSYATGELKFTAEAGVTSTWNGGGGNGNWTTGANWSGTVPLTGADIVFAGTSHTSILTEANRTTGAITFDSTAGAFIISGNTITLGGNLANNSTSLQTINSAMTLNADRSVSANSGGLVFGGNVTVSNTAALAGTLTITGNESVSIRGVVADGPAAGGRLVKSGSGTLTLTAVNTFTGSLTIAGGTVAANSSKALGAAATVLTNSLIFEGGTLQATGDINSPINRLIELTGNGTFDTNGNTITINSVIEGSGQLTKTASGSLILSQPGAKASTYSGDTLIQQGSLVIGYAKALGSDTGSTTVQSGASLVINSSFDVTGEAVTISGNGIGVDGGALHLTSGQANWNGSVTLGADATIRADANATLGFSKSTVSLGSNTLTIATGASAFVNLSSTLSGTGGITKTGAGTLTISGASTGYSGLTTVSDGVLVVLKGLGNGSSSLTVDSGATLQIEIQKNLSLSFSTISLNGTGAGGIATILNETSGRTAISGPISLEGGTLIQSSTGQLDLLGDIDTKGHALSVVNRSSPMTLSGNISGAGSLALASGSTGELVLSGNNTYSGTTTIFSGGAITVASATALGSGAGGTTVSSGAALRIQSTGGLAVAAEALFVSGSGIGNTGAVRNVSGNNTYQGAITLSGPTTFQSDSGTLELSGSLTGSQTVIIQGPGTVFISGDTSAYTSGVVNISSGTFASGDLVGTTVNVGPLAGGGTGTPTYSPGGLSSGPLTASKVVNLGNLIVSSGGQLLVDLGASGFSDQIVTTGAPNLAGGGELRFVFNDAGITTGGDYTLVTANAGGIAVGDLSFTTNIAGLSGIFSVSNSPLSTLSFKAYPTAVWSNTTGNSQWGDGANWNIRAVPAGGSAVGFDVTSATTVDTQTDRNAGGIAFESTSAAVTIARNEIALYGKVENKSAALQTISSGLTLLGDVTVSATSGNLALSGPISLSQSTTPQTLTFTGAEDTLVSGVISNGAAAAGALVKTGAGTTTLTAANTFKGTTTISEGTLLVSGSMNAGNALSVQAGGKLAGSGMVGGMVSLEGTLSPGTSLGTLTTGSETWLNGGAYNWQIYDATGAAGTGYDTLSINGTLDLTSLGRSGFDINLWSLSSVSPDTSGDAINFADTDGYSWTLASATGGILGFEAADFSINVSAINGTSGFANAFSGSFDVSMSGTDLVLHFTPVPEPGTGILLTGLAPALLLRRFRRRA